MLYQGIIGGGSSPVEPQDLSPVLLWTNPNPTNEFAGQTVSLDLTEYAGVIVEFNLTSEDERRRYVASRVYVTREDATKTAFGGGAMLSFGSSSSLQRNVKMNDTGVIFGEGYADSTVTPYAMIPYKIYGVKEYVVEPVGQLKNVTEVYDLSVSGNDATKTFTATKKGSYFVFGPGYSAERVTLTTTGEILFNVSQSWHIINLAAGETITCKSLSSGSYTCNVYLLE